MVTIDVEVDIDDVLWEMSSLEKEELCQQLIEDGYGPGPEDFGGLELTEILQPETYSEGELVDLIKSLWTNRNFIDNKMVDGLRQYLREQNVL